MGGSRPHGSLGDVYAVAFGAVVALGAAVALAVGDAAAPTIVRRRE